MNRPNRQPRPASSDKPGTQETEYMDASHDRRDGQRHVNDHYQPTPRPNRRISSSTLLATGRMSSDDRRARR